MKTTLGPIVAPVQAGETPIRETKKRLIVWSSNDLDEKVK